MNNIYKELIKNADIALRDDKETTTIGLYYDDEKYNAPILLFKYNDADGLNLQEILKDNNIFIIEDSELLKDLDINCEIGSEVLEKHYEATAVIYSYLTRYRKKVESIKVELSCDLYNKYKQTIITLIKDIEDNYLGYKINSIIFKSLLTGRV